MLDFPNIFNSADINNLFTYYNQNMDYWSYLFCKLHKQTCFCPFSLFDIKWTYLVLSLDGSTDETTEHVSLLQSPSHFLETGEPSNENLPSLETTTFEEHDDQLDTSDPTQSALATVLENISPYDIGRLCYSESIFSDFQKINFIENGWKPSTSTKLDAQYCKSKNRFIFFRLKWFDNHKRLAYSDYSKGKGGWCLSCVFFK